MAKVKFSALISEMRGKLNGSVFSKNRGGNYLRTKVTPANLQTAPQTTARARLAQFSQAWRSLSEVQRAAWSGAVDSFSSTNVFGDTVNPTGNTLFTKLNINSAIAGGSQMNVPPALVAVPSPSNVALTATATGNVLNLDFDPSSVPAGLRMEIQATPQLSPGISNANSKFTTLVVVDDSFSSGDSISAEYVAKYGALAAGRKVFVRVRFIHIASGIVSQKIATNVIVA